MKVHIKIKEHGGVRSSFDYNGDKRTGIQQLNKFYENLKSFTETISNTRVKISELRNK